MHFPKVEMCFAELPGEKEGLEVKLILTMCAKRCPETWLVLIHSRLARLGKAWHV